MEYGVRNVESGVLTASVVADREVVVRVRASKEDRESDEQDAPDQCELDDVAPHAPDQDDEWPQLLRHGQHSEQSGPLENCFWDAKQRRRSSRLQHAIAVVKLPTRNRRNAGVKC
eukprot:1981007-Rhodomonas_salina.2